MTHRLLHFALVLIASAVTATPVISATLLYGLDRSGAKSLVTIDLGDGTVTTIGPIGPAATAPSALATAPDGTLYAADTTTDKLYTVGKTTGTFVEVGSFNIGNEVNNSSISGLTFIGGSLYGVENITDILVTIDTSTGEATAIGGFGTAGGYSGNAVGGLAYDGATLFATDLTTGTVRGKFMSIDITNGAATSIAQFPSGLNAPNGLLYDASSDTIYTVDASTDAIYSVTPAGVTTLVTALDPSSATIFGWSFAPDAAVVPLPAPLLLLASGVAGIGLLTRRRRTWD